MRKIIFPVLLLTVIVVSCKKKDTIREEPKLPTYASDAHFLTARLKQFALDLAPVLSNASTRDLIRNFAKQKFDEEYEVLIKDMFNDPAIASLVPVSKSNQLHEDLLNRSGERLYPQIYIPRMQYLDDNTASKGIDDPSKPTSPLYVFYSGDTEADSAFDEETYPGYSMVNDKLVFNKMVDEQFASENEVWIFSLNETVDQQGKFPLPCESSPCRAGCLVDFDTFENGDCGGGGGGGGTGGGGTGGGGTPPLGPDDDPTDAPMARKPFPELNHNKINFMIQNIKVATHKESWLAGSSEVAIRAKLVTHNGRKLGQSNEEQYEYTSDQYSNYRGNLIIKIKRKDIKNIKNFIVNYSMQKNWQNEVPIQDPVHFIYVIFERDSWPAIKNQDERYAIKSLITGEDSPGSFPLWYRSGGKKQGNNYPYARYYFTNTLFLATSDVYAGSGLVQNPDMAFNTVLY